MAQQLLGRHVAGAPLEHAGLGLERRVARLGDAEVDDLGVAVEGDEDVVRADVAMDEAERAAVEAAELVRIVERADSASRSTERAMRCGKPPRAAKRLAT